MSLLATSGKTDAEITSTLGLPSKGFYFTKKKVKQYDTAAFAKAVKIILDAEANVKGSSAAPAVAVMDTMLVELCGIFKKK